VCEFSKISNELYYFYLNSGSSQSTTWAELRAVDLSTFSYRVLRRFPQVKYATGLTVNADGSLIAVGVGVGDPKADYNLNEYHFAIVRPDGSSFPGWAFDPADPPDFTGAGEHPYWSPFDPYVIRTKGLSNVLTSATLPSPICFGCSQPNMKSFPPSHSCWSMDGEVVARSGGHPDCHPLDQNRGGQTRIARENGAYLYVTTMEKGAGSGTPPSGDRVAVTYHKVISGSNYTHPPPHFSRDGRYLLFLSTVADTSVAAPPGGTNNQGRLVADLFVVLDP
jgi:hypothetical protein